jgi:hypothetical protein
MSNEENINYTEAEALLNTGMLLPNEIDFDNSTLKLFTSERRPFEKPGGWNQYDKKYYISFIHEGSVIFLPDGITQEHVRRAGKSTESKFRPGRDIVFGNAFLYPITFGKP